MYFLHDLNSDPCEYNITWSSSQFLNAKRLIKKSKLQFCFIYRIIVGIRFIRYFDILTLKLKTKYIKKSRQLVQNLNKTSSVCFAIV